MIDRFFTKLALSSVAGVLMLMTVAMGIVYADHTAQSHSVSTSVAKSWQDWQQQAEALEQQAFQLIKASSNPRTVSYAKAGALYKEAMRYYSLAQQGCLDEAKARPEASSQLLEQAEQFDIKSREALMKSRTASGVVYFREVRGLL